jgi:hypothetical protein
MQSNLSQAPLEIAKLMVLLEKFRRVTVSKSFSTKKVNNLLSLISIELLNYPNACTAAHRQFLKKNHSIITKLLSFSKKVLTALNQAVSHELSRFPTINFCD